MYLHSESPGTLLLPLLPLWRTVGRSGVVTPSPPRPFVQRFVRMSVFVCTRRQLVAAGGVHRECHQFATHTSPFLPFLCFHLSGLATYFHFCPSVLCIYFASFCFSFPFSLSCFIVLRSRVRFQSLPPFGVMQYKYTILACNAI